MLSIELSTLIISAFDIIGENIEKESGIKTPGPTVALELIKTIFPNKDNIFYDKIIEEFNTEILDQYIEAKKQKSIDNLSNKDKEFIQDVVKAVRF